MSTGNNYFNSIMKDMLEQSNIKILPQKCPKHPNTHLVLFPNSSRPVCPIEYQKELDQQSVAEASNFYYNQKIKDQQAVSNNAKNSLIDHSIIDDDSIEKAVFKDFKTNTSNRDSIVLQEAKIVAKHYLDVKHPFNTLLTGKSGTGKSFLAMAILHYVNNAIGGQYLSKKLGYCRCLFINVNQLMLRIEESFHDHDSDYKNRIVNLISHAYLVVLDDFGTEVNPNKSFTSAMPFAQRILYSILDSRQRTIFTSNETLDDLTHMYNESIVSRINMNLQIIKFKDIPDYRSIKGSMNLFKNVDDPLNNKSQNDARQDYSDTTNFKKIHNRSNAYRQQEQMNEFNNYHSNNPHTNNSSHYRPNNNNHLPHGNADKFVWGSDSQH